jgi:hypothetical protein
MSLNAVMKQAFEEWADEAPAADDFAASALAHRRRRQLRTRVIGGALVVLTIAAIGLTTTVLPNTGHGTIRPAGRPTGSQGHQQPAPPVQHYPAPAGWTVLPLSTPHAGQTSIEAQPNQYPPVNLVAAGTLAVSSYAYRGVRYLLNTSTNTYQRTTYATVSVAPGLGLAAVTESPDTNRIGIVDTRTMTVIRWISMPHSVANATWSPDGTKLLATARGPWIHAGKGGIPDNTKARVGFFIIDMVTGTMLYVTLPTANSQDAALDNPTLWTPDSLVRVVAVTDSGKPLYYQADGTQVAEPNQYEGQGYYLNVGTSPDGKYALSSDQSYIVGASDGSHIKKINIQQAWAWVGNTMLLVRGCEAGCANEFRNRLEVIFASHDHAEVLTGTTTGHDDWEPAFALR